MEYRIDPKTGNRLSILGFGMMRLPRGITGTDQEKVTAMVGQAVESGVNYFDTAFVYPGSEVATGRALAETGFRDKIFLATKLPHQQVRKTEDLDRIFAEQLKRLQTDRIDYYLMHNLPSVTLWQRLVERGVIDWLAAKQADGFIGQVGFSFHGKQVDFLELLEAFDWGFCQMQYNYLDVNYQAGQTGLKTAAERGMMVVIMEPLRGGKLAVGLPAKAESAFKAAEPGVSIASWGLRWIWDQPEPTVVLSGMGTMEQLTDNLATAATANPGMLSQAQHDLIKRAIDIIEAGYKVPCTACNYCMPCPHGVNIPDCFTAYNTRATQGLIAGMSQYFSGVGMPNPDRYSGPDKCQACGTCERKCPQNIAIIDSLKEVKKHMEPFWTKAVKLGVRIMMG
ncbi:MAG: aldo/keto reductase [Coriobacteriales bacterium]|jgi:predicted aldo/keto reductase-like oxidoreductase|nr:aldo/keto reductase [Coriobacteriales bacterium]